MGSFRVLVMGSFRVLVERQRADPIASEFLSVANSAIRLRALRFSPLLLTRSLRTIMKTSGSGRHGICRTFPPWGPLRPLPADIVVKVFLGWRTKIPRAADAFDARRCEGPYCFLRKSITDHRSSAERRRGSREAQRSAFARFFG